MFGDVELNKLHDRDFDNPDWEDPIIGRTQKNARKFAAMDPVVDLESLRGMRVYHDKPYFR